MSEAKKHNGTIRVLKVLEFLSHREEGSTLSEIAKELKIAKSTLFPIIHTLKDLHYVTLNQKTDRFKLGLKLFELGCRYSANENYLGMIKKEMALITESSKETCHFGVLTEGDVFYLLKQDSPHELRFNAVVGKRLPAYATAIGKALLSQFSTIEEIKKLYPNGLEKLLPNTINDYNELFRQIQEIKKNGYAIETEESSKDITCVAVPIITSGLVVAAISIATPIFRHSEEARRRNIELLFRHKSVIENILGDVDINFVSQL